MALEKDNIYEFGFGRTDKVSKNVNFLLFRIVFSLKKKHIFRIKKPSDKIWGNKILGGRK